MEWILVAIILFLAYRNWVLKKRNSDIKTDLTQTEAKLDNYIEEEGTGQAKFDGILASMAEGVLVIDSKGEIVLMNPSLRKTFLIDQTPEGKRPLEVIRNVKIQEIVERTLQNKEKIISEELTLTVPEERFLKVNAVPIEWDGENEGAILVFHDITELRRLERIRQDFVANVSHELRTPISSIKGYAETLLDGAIDDKENLRKFVEIIDRDSQRLAGLIDDLLDLAKIESGKMKMTLQSLDIREVIRRTLSIIEKQAQAKSLDISCEFPENVPEVLGDETRLSQVVLNLLDNAIKYTPQGGQIGIEVLAAYPFVQVNVADTGLGIPDKDLSRVFERFYRVDKARSRELGGTGLGLSIVKHIVQSHGGEVWVKSQLEKGSIFSFIIPQASKEQSA
jgi:two-component system phosphate regulon sensor histidine kinase PhoR